MNTFPGCCRIEIDASSNGKWVKYEDYEKLLRALAVTSQANRELAAAMERGPGWYTKGLSGMYSQCWTWLLKGLAAAKPYEQDIADLPRDPDV